MADHCHEYKGRSRTCPNATDGTAGRSHRLKLLKKEIVAGRRGQTRCLRGVVTRSVVQHSHRAQPGSDATTRLGEYRIGHSRAP